MKGKQLRLTFNLVLAIGLGGVPFGCNSDRPELTADELNQRTAALAGDLAESVSDSVQFLEDDLSMNALAEGLNVIGQMLGVEDEEQQDTNNYTSPMPGDKEEPDSQDMAEGLEQFLETCLLTEENLETFSLNNAVYLIPGEVFCDEECFGESSDDCMMNCPAGETWCADEQQACLAEQQQNRQECVSELDQIEVRIALSATLDGVTLSLLVGPQQSAVVTLEIQPDRLTLSSDLAQLKSAVEHISAIFDEEPVEIPGTVTGELAWVLQKHAEKDVSLTFQIREAIQVEVDLPQDGGRIELSAQQALDALSIRINGIAKTLQLAVHIEPLQLLAPFAEFFESATGNLILELAGLDGELLLGGDANDVITLEGFGWGDGPNRLRHDSVELVSVELNASHNHQLDLSAQESNGMPLFSFDPAVELDVYLNLGHLDPYLDPQEEPAPSELCDQTYSLRFSADTGLAQMMPQPATQTMDDTIKIVNGTLALSSDASQASVVATAGQCLVGIEECQASENFLLECIEAVDCP